MDFSPSPPSLLPSPSTLPSNLTGGGFQLSLVSVPSDLLPLIQAATGLLGGLRLPLLLFRNELYNS